MKFSHLTAGLSEKQAGAGNKLRAGLADSCIEVVNRRYATQLGCLLFGQRVSEEGATADFRTSEVFEQAGLAQRRVDLDMEAKPGVRAVVRGDVVQGHYVWEGQPPEVVETNERFPEHRSESPAGPARDSAMLSVPVVRSQADRGLVRFDVGKKAGVSLGDRFWIIEDGKLRSAGEVFMVTGTPGGRTIINTVLQTILNVIDHGASAQAAVDLGRIHHQWLPDQIFHEGLAFSPDTLRILESRGHALRQIDNLGVAEVIVVREDGLEGGVDRRQADGGAVGY